VPRITAPALRRMLLRIDRVDSALRARWVASRFTDRALERSLDRLGDAALAWLRDVVAVHGWPDDVLVGRRAAGAAVRLVQHVEHASAFRQRCLRLVRAAAARGDLAWHHVAYLTDALRVAQGRAQVYGTKFRRRRGALVPLPIARPGGVDRRRAGVGLAPLATYARQLQRRFG
jgi:hypothetical protein